MAFVIPRGILPNKPHALLFPRLPKRESHEVLDKMTLPRRSCQIAAARRQSRYGKKMVAILGEINEGPDTENSFLKEKEKEKEKENGEEPNQASPFRRLAQ